ncbi:MAG: hypothetical protein CK424_05250 [Legionella sp.]|nr:MAG: hypothetical protein CK424_05250 [Legionella sp.]
MQFAQEKECASLKNNVMQRIDEFRALAHKEQDDATKYAILNIAFYLEDGLSVLHAKEYFSDIQHVLNNNLKTLQESSPSLLKLAHSVIDMALSSLATLEIKCTSLSLFNRHKH